MENTHQKWVNISYLAVALLVGYVVFAAGAYISGTYDLEAKFKSIDLAMRGLSVLVGALVFWGCYSHTQTNTFMNEVAVELSRVTWPTQKETSNATFIVIIMVLISGMVLGFLDYFWTMLLKWFI